MNRIGVFGGTFNPPHIGHWSAINTFFNALDLDRLFVIPTGCPPHKQITRSDDPFLRLRMARAAFEDFSRGIIVSDYEVTKPGVSYTVDTLRHFSSPDSKLFLLCGTDMFLSFETWREFERIFELSSIVCMPRENNMLDDICLKAEEFKKKYNADCIIIDGNIVELSSTEIRNMIAEKKDVSAYLPAQVLQIIKEEKLYV